MGTTNLPTGKYDQKIERVINEISKANLSVCCLQEVRRLSNNLVIITNKQNNVEQKYELCWFGHTAKRHWYRH